jgi:hypothetical protein
LSGNINKILYHGEPGDSIFFRAAGAIMPRDLGAHGQAAITPVAPGAKKDMPTDLEASHPAAAGLHQQASPVFVEAASRRDHFVVPPWRDSHRKKA